jgi:hypothetical protein
MRAWLRRIIVRAAPTCTLWETMFDRDALRFRFNHRWVITYTEYMELRK